MITESLLKTYSLGVVARDILEDELYVDIAPIEVQTNIDGDLTLGSNIKAMTTDMSGGTDSINLDRTDLIKARWLPDGDTNRLEPPTVCRGEIVKIFRYSDSDHYYWNTVFNQLGLRKLEKRTIVVSNKQSIDLPPEKLLENSYYTLMDTINKIIKLRSSDTDGEYTTYDVTIDTAEGQFEIVDGKSNQILWDSRTDTLTTTTNEAIKTNTKNTTHNSTDSIHNLTKNKTDDIGQHYQINLKTYAVNNGSDELIQTLTDFVQACHDAIGIGNMGFGVPMDGATQSAFDAIKARLQGFM